VKFSELPPTIIWSLDQSLKYGQQCEKEFLAKRQNEEKAIPPQDNILETDKNKNLLHSLKTKNQNQREKFSRITKQIELAVNTREKIEKEVEAGKNRVTELKKLIAAAENRVREAQKLIAAAKKVERETEEKIRTETFKQEKIIKNIFDAKHELREITKKIESLKYVEKQSNLKTVENMIGAKQNDLKTVEKMIGAKQNDLKTLENLLETKQNDLKLVENLKETRYSKLAALDAEINAKKCKLKIFSINKLDASSSLALNVPKSDEQPAAAISSDWHIKSSSLDADKIERFETPHKSAGMTKRLSRKRSVSQSVE